MECNLDDLFMKDINCKTSLNYIFMEYNINDLFMKNIFI